MFIGLPFAIVPLQVGCLPSAFAAGGPRCRWWGWLGRRSDLLDLFAINGGLGGCGGGIDHDAAALKSSA